MSLAIVKAGCAKRGPQSLCLVYFVYFRLSELEIEIQHLSLWL